MKPLRKVAVLIETSREPGRDLLRGVMRFYQENPNWSVYFQQQHLGAALPRWINSWRGDGILARVNDRKTAAALIETKLPLIDLRGGAHQLGHPLFGTENSSVARLAYEHLSSCGLKTFAFVGEPTGRHVYDDERRDLFVKFVQDRGAECHVFTNKLNNRVVQSWEAQQNQLARWLTRLPKPVGVLCCHDDRGQQVLDACRRAELQVPDEVAVMGVDNDEFLGRLAVPPLTSIDIGSERIGYDAASLLDRLMDGKTTFKKSVLYDALGVVKRQSTDVISCEDPEVARALRFIRANACNHISVDDVQRQVHLSRTLLNRRFKNYIGHPPKQEILHVQIEAGRELLINSTAPLQSIAEQCGFREAWYFIAVFRKFIGLTPGVYRAKYGVNMTRKRKR
jgi:LacI family transcriptional regulator